MTSDSQRTRQRRYQYRAWPTAPQERALGRLFGCVRFVQNTVIERRENARMLGMPYPSTTELNQQILVDGKQGAFAFLSEVSSVPLQQALRDVNTGYDRFFQWMKSGRKGRRAGAPKFRSRRGAQSARFTKNAFTRGHLPVVTRPGSRHATVTLPKVGPVKFTLSRPLPAEPSSVTVIRRPSGRYELSFVGTEPVPVPARRVHPGRVAGVDLGLTDLVAIVYSDGTRETVPAPKFLRLTEKRLRQAQQRLSRAQRGSRNREDARVRVARLHQKVSDQRRDFAAQLASRLANENQVVVLESLSISGLVKGRSAKAVHDAGWGMLTSAIAAACEERGTTLIRAPRDFPSTQLCAPCGRRDTPKPLHVREWTCPGCGTRLDRDYNAATNLMILAGGHSASPSIAQAMELGTARGSKVRPHRHDPEMIRELTAAQATTCTAPRTRPTPRTRPLNRQARLNAWKSAMAQARNDGTAPAD